VPLATLNEHEFSEYIDDGAPDSLRTINDCQESVWKTQASSDAISKHFSNWCAVFTAGLYKGDDPKSVEIHDGLCERF
jgi:hypothetical protein